jgi:hypothetical protein
VSVAFVSSKSGPMPIQQPEVWRKREDAMDIGLPETEHEIEVTPAEEPVPAPAPVEEPVEEPVPA